MAETTVKKLADVVGIPVDTLLTQMKEAGFLSLCRLTSLSIQVGAGEITLEGRFLISLRFNQVTSL